MKNPLVNFSQNIKIILLTLLLLSSRISVFAQSVYTPSVTGDALLVNSLRQAIIDSNQDGTVSIIRLASGVTYTLNIALPEILFDATTLDLDISNDGILTIETIGGAGMPPAIIRANFVLPVSDSRVFDIQANAKLILKNVIIENGNTNAEGGGVRNNDGVLNLLDGAIVRNNNANGAGGGILNTGNTAVLRLVGSSITGNSASSGGGIHNGGGARTVIISTSDVSSNSSVGLGGGILNMDTNSQLFISSSTLTNNYANAIGGGAITNQNGASLTITCSSLTLNTTLGQGGGILNKDPSSRVIIGSTLISQSRANQGGGVYNSNQANTFIINGSTISLNSGTTGGGGVLNTGNNSLLLISSATISANEAKGNAAKGGGVHNTGGGATLVITCASIISNTSFGDGAGVYNHFGGSQLRVENTLISFNTITNNGGGAGIYNRSQAILSNTSITHNQTSNSGGGVMNVFGGVMSIINGCDISYNQSNNEGGGISQSSTGTSLIISSATITNNIASGVARGGGIYNDDAFLSITATTISNNTGRIGGIYHIQNTNGNNLNIINSTLSTNIGADRGGAIRLEGTAILVDLTHVTIANNSASTFGAISNPNNGTVNLQNSIIGNNTSPAEVEGLGVSPTIVSSIVSDGSVLDVNIQNIDPTLAPLEIFSGSLIHRLLPASPALNVGTSSAITLDQIGRLRNDGFPDIGAFEGVLPCENVTLPSGVQNVWLGCISSDWFDGRNWSTGSVPSSSSDVILLSMGSPILIINTDISCKKIIAQKGTKYYVINGAKIFFTSP
jgi:hypothetical protein